MAQGHRGARPHVPGKQAAKVVKGFEEKVGHGLRGRSPFVRPLSALKRVRESGTHKAIGRGYLLLADYDSQLIRRENQFVSPPKVKSCEKTAKGKRDRARPPTD